MPIREFELFHGAALTKIVRSDRPMTLRMIEPGFLTGSLRWPSRVA